MTSQGEQTSSRCCLSVPSTSAGHVRLAVAELAEAAGRTGVAHELLERARQRIVIILGDGLPGEQLGDARDGARVRRAR